MDFKLKYVQRTRVDGKYYYYFRRGSIRATLEGEPGSPKFLQSYQRANAGFNKPVQRSGPNSVGALIEAYLGSTEFSNLASGSQRVYRIYIDTVRETLGPFDVGQIRRKHIMQMRDNLSHKPAACNLTMAVTARIFDFAVDREWIDTSPAVRLKKLKTGEHEPWTDTEIERFMEAAPPPVVAAAMIALYTGQRMSDCIRMAWTDIQGDGINVRQQKTKTQLWIPIHPDLQRALSLIPRDGVTILTDGQGRSWTAPRLRAEMRKITGELDINKVFHGFRKTAAVMLAEAGCSDEELKSITGHKSSSILAHYTKQASQRIRAASAIEKLSAYKSVKP